MNILFFAVDTLRADHLGCYGYARDTSPTLDALAGEGIRFENAVTNTAHTGPTFTTIYTGQHPFTHGIVTTGCTDPNVHDQLLDDTTPTLAEVLAKGGRLTAAFDNLLVWPTHPAHFARGYDYYVRTLDPKRSFCAAVLAEQINERLLPWIDYAAAKHRPFFLLVHYWDPHQPYNQPEPYRSWHSGKPGHEEFGAFGARPYTPRWGWSDRLTPRSREWIDLYDGEVTYVDAQVRRVLDALKKAGLYDETAIFVTADHGEDFEEHDAPFEHRQPYESTVHVPLIVKPSRDWPAAAPARVAPQVAHIDLMPTLLELAGCEPPERMDGKSWLPLLAQPNQTFHDYVYISGGAIAQRGRWRAPELAVRTNTAKYVRRTRVWLELTHTAPNTHLLCAPPWRWDKERQFQERIDFFNSLPAEELYDLAQDPCETTNILPARPDLAREMRDALQAYVATNPERA